MGSHSLDEVLECQPVGRLYGLEDQRYLFRVVQLRRDLPLPPHRRCGRGRSTHGVCMGVLSWLIDEGAAEGVDLSGLAVALASRYSDDEAGSPWSWILYLDARASSDQQAALEDIFTGRAGGD